MLHVDIISLHGNLINVRWDFLKTRLDETPLKFSNMKIGLWKEICMWTWPSPFSLFSGDWWVFPPQSTSERKRFTENFPHRWAHRMQKHHLMLPRYSHYEYLISKSAQFSVFHFSMQAPNNRWFYEVSRTFDLQKTMFCFFCSERFKEQTTPSRKDSNPIKLNLCWFFLHNFIKSVLFVQGNVKFFDESSEKVLICNEKVSQ